LTARFGGNAVTNGFHASASAEAADAEIDFFFPQIRRENLPTMIQVEETLNKKPAPRPHVEQSKSLQDVLVDGLTQLCRVKPIKDDAVTWLAEWLIRNNPNKPSVATTAVVEEPKDVLDQIAENTGSPVEVVWALGGPGSGRDENVSVIADNYGHQVLDVMQLLKVSESSGSEYGELLKDCKLKGRPVPTHVPVNLVRDAMLSSKTTSKFIVKGFPSTMDEALLFEQTVGGPTKIVYFDCIDETKAKRIEELKMSYDKGGQDYEVDEADLKAFNTMVEYYQQSGKIKKISTDGASDLLKSRIKKVFR
jgi:UMP-CMP kinase